MEKYQPAGKSPHSYFTQNLLLPVKLSGYRVVQIEHLYRKQTAAVQPVDNPYDGGVFIYES